MRVYIPHTFSVAHCPVVSQFPLLARPTPLPPHFLACYPPLAVFAIIRHLPASCRLHSHLRSNPYLDHLLCTICPFSNTLPTTAKTPTCMQFRIR